MSHNHYIPWSDASMVLAMAPNFPHPDPTGYPSPVSRRPSECFSEISNFSMPGSMPGSRRGSAANFISEMENRSQWQSAASDSTSRGPLSNFSFLKNLTIKDKKDGPPPKKRGPKPDSKPALTRRQELNRQAQRTHRERKEQYVKSLEQEVYRLRELFEASARERDAFADENRRLKELLMAHGISFDLASPSNNLTTSYGGSSRGSVSGFGPSPNSTGYTSPPTGPQSTVSAPPGQSITPPHQCPPAGPNGPMDYDQLGIDFVLTLERPCMDHMQYLMVRVHGRALSTTTNPHASEPPASAPTTHSNPEDDPDYVHHLVSGHALMATCPPASHIAARPDEPYPHQMPDLAPADLKKLLDIGNRVPDIANLEGEVTPVMAWAMILHSGMLDVLGRDGVERIKTELGGKVRCYGFGAVVEEFEVQDALMSAVAAVKNGNMGPNMPIMAGGLMGKVGA